MREWIRKRFDFNDPLLLPSIGVYFVTFAILYWGAGVNYWIAFILAVVTQFAFGTDHLRAKWLKKRDD